MLQEARAMKLILGTGEGIHGWDERRGLTLLQGIGSVRALARARPDATRLYAAANGRQLFRSDDRGNSWQALPVAFEGYEVSSLAVHPRDENRLLAGLESAALFQSADAGESWNEVPAIRAMAEAPGSVWHVPWGPARGHVRTPAWDAEEPARIYLPIEVGGVVRTEDSGGRWENVHGGIHDDVHALAVHPERNRALYAATRTGFGRSEDYGRTWNGSSEGLTHLYCRAIAIDGADADCVYTAGASTGPGGWRRPTGAETALFRSDDGARTWKRLTEGLPDGFVPFIDALAADPGTGDRVFFVTNGGEMFGSTDRGARWEGLGQAPSTRCLLVLPS
jgi:photosystem II stability/assembly factor-like uncharacterized protein